MWIFYICHFLAVSHLILVLHLRSFSDTYYHCFEPKCKINEQQTTLHHLQTIIDKNIHHTVKRLQEEKLPPEHIIVTLQSEYDLNAE